MNSIIKYIENLLKKIYSSLKKNRGFLYIILIIVFICLFKKNRDNITVGIVLYLIILVFIAFIIGVYLNSFDIIGSFNLSIVELSNLWIFNLVVMFLAWFSIKGLKAKSAYGSSLILISIFYFVVPFWVAYFSSCRKVLKSIHKSSALLSEKTVRSILIANTAWWTLFANLLSKNHASINYVEVISIIVSTVTAAYYPLLDMYKLTRTKLDEYEKEKNIEAERERIENESNGSKNYTAW